MDEPRCHCYSPRPPSHVFIVLEGPGDVEAVYAFDDLERAKEFQLKATTFRSEPFICPLNAVRQV